MTKIAVVSDGANWVLDNIKKDFQKYTSLEVVGPRKQPDIIWSVDFWSLGRALNFGRPVVAHLHHINKPQIKMYKLDLLKKAVACVTNNRFTFKEMQDLGVNDNIRQIPYWVLSKAREPKYEVEPNKFFNIGSFQKDGETRTRKAKLVKGPDILIDAIEEINKSVEVNVVLAGFCREYVIGELEKRGIRYEYHHKVDNLNPLYDKLDAYIISSRTEGGPQAVLEATYRKVPVVATDVGIVSEVIHPNCLCEPDEIAKKIFKSKDYVMYNYQNVQNFLHEVIVPRFDQLFQEFV